VVVGPEVRIEVVGVVRVKRLPACQQSKGRVFIDIHKMPVFAVMVLHAEHAACLIGGQGGSVKWLLGQYLQNLLNEGSSVAVGEVRAVGIEEQEAGDSRADELVELAAGQRRVLGAADWAMVWYNFHRGSSVGECVIYVIDGHGGDITPIYRE
jgi:hypothetical protein